ncbi:hypothetical protein T09_8315 [Trichinella sp. T9]|nr:hypothetical protein T09_8315 [Trichinella sp. T9]
MPWPFVSIAAIARRHKPQLLFNVDGRGNFCCLLNVLNSRHSSFIGGSPSPKYGASALTFSLC